jgi:hypothetical protein
MRYLKAVSTEDIEIEAEKLSQIIDEEDTATEMGRDHDHQGERKSQNRAVGGATAQAEIDLPFL